MVYVNDGSGNDEDWDVEDMMLMEDYKPEGDENDHVDKNDYADHDQVIETHGLKPPVHTEVVAQHIVTPGLPPRTSGPAPTKHAERELMLSNISQSLDPVAITTRDDAWALHQQQTREITTLHMQLREKEAEIRSLHRELNDRHDQLDAAHRAADCAERHAEHAVNRAERQAEQAETELRMIRSMQGMLGMGTTSQFGRMGHRASLHVNERSHECDGCSRHHDSSSERWPEYGCECPHNSSLEQCGERGRSHDSSSDYECPTPQHTDANTTGLMILSTHMAQGLKMSSIHPKNPGMR
jgi:hypothetical protein